ncbi:uncharacterized protein LOC131008083 [Salvia miltiorrhiza]|uniref:uncharacterized protein LOC131008083 n=1 Tax=Salvia miltiorrhiza TaxID=226208 RepID=UPI0025ACC6B0|nr:uncharacterized protein LOC131008083 [Salvia miltiorrhiza]
MGKGYYTLRFQFQEDKATAKANLLWDLSVGSLWLRDWVRYFNPYKEPSSLAQVWVRIYYLPVEFWHPEVISGIGSWLGQPLKIDGNSMTEDVGHFVRMLVEIDLAQPLPVTLNIDGGDYAFPVEFSYEYLPIFCHRCKITGHSMEKCRKGDKSQGKTTDEVEKGDKGPEGHAVGKAVVQASVLHANTEALEVVDKVVEVRSALTERAQVEQTMGEQQSGSSGNYFSPLVTAEQSSEMADHRLYGPDYGCVEADYSTG